MLHSVNYSPPQVGPYEKADEKTVAGLVSFYQSLANKYKSGVELTRTYFKRGVSTEHQMLWAKLPNIVEWCQPRGVNPTHFVRAQFELWHKTTKIQDSFPTPRFMAVTEVTVKRYVAWKAKRKSLISATVQTTTDSFKVLMASLKRNRPTLTEEEFFTDLLLIKMAPPDAVKAHPIFMQLRSSGFYDDEYSQLVLKDYL